MTANQNDNASGQYTVDMLTAARNRCFEQSEEPALPMAVRTEFSVRYGQLDQLIDELMTKQFHQKSVNSNTGDGSVDDMIRTNTELSNESAALDAVPRSADAAESAFAILDKMLKIGMPLVEV